LASERWVARSDKARISEVGSALARDWLVEALSLGLRRVCVGVVRSSSADVVGANVSVVAAGWARASSGACAESVAKRAGWEGRDWSADGGDEPWNVAQELVVAVGAEHARGISGDGHQA
jgi:hypothetical protein